MEYTQHGTVECCIKGTKILSLALSSLAFFVITLLFPVSSTLVGKLLTYGIYTFSGMGMIVVLVMLHLKYVRQTPWTIVTKNSLKWFVPMKMDYATLDFAVVERFYVVKIVGVATVYAHCCDGSRVATGISSAFLSHRDVDELVQEATARLGSFNSLA